MISSYHIPEMNHTEAIEVLDGNLGMYLGERIIIKQDDWDAIM